MISQAPALGPRAERTNLTILALVVSAAAGAGLGFGSRGVVAVGGIALLAAGAVCARGLIRRGWESALLLAAGTALVPIPQPIRTGLVVATLGLVIGVAVADSVWPRAGAPALGRPEVVILSGLLAMDVVLAAGAVHSGHPGPLPSFIVAAVLSLAFTWALYRRHLAVGPMPIAIGLAGASALASLLVLLRLGGLPLIGTNPSATYVDAKDVVVGKLGDVNGQALIVMLGLPMLLALALHVRQRVPLIATTAGVIMSGLALLVLLSRSSLIGACVGIGVVTIAMAPMSRRRVLLVCVAAAGAATYFASGVERLGADNTNLTNRSVLWRTAVDFWYESPVLGHGVESWPRLIAEQVRWAPPSGDGGAHNLALSALVAGGLVAVLIQVALLVTVAYLGVRNLRRLRAAGDALRHAVVAGALGAFTAQVVRGGFEATGWPGTRTNDLRTWGGLLLTAVVVLITTSAPPGPRAEQGR